MAEVGQNGKIKVDNSNNLISGEINKTFLKQFIKELLSRIDVKKTEIFFTGGLEDDSYASAIMCGTISSLVKTGYSVLSQKYKNVKMYEDISPTYHETNLELTFDVVISLSFIQFLISAIKANSYKKKFEEGNYEG